MEEALKDLISSYKSGLQTYFDSLTKENSVVREALQLIDDMMADAEMSQDYSAFMEVAQEKDYFNQIIAFHTKLGNELYNTKPKSSHIPTASEIAKGYHLAYEAIDPSHKAGEVQGVYQRVFALERESKSGPEFLARLEQEDLFLKMSRCHLVRVMRQGLSDLLSSGRNVSSNASESKGLVSNPQMEHYFRSMEESIESSKSVIEMEWNSFVKAENARFSNLWDNAFLFATFHSLLSPLLSYRMTGSDEDKADTKYAFEFVSKFYGITWDELFDIPRIRELFERTIFGATKEVFISQGIANAKALQAELKKDLIRCIGNAEESSHDNKQVAFFRGEEITLNQVTEKLKSGFDFKI